MIQFGIFAVLFLNFQKSSGVEVKVNTIGSSALFSCDSKETPAWNRQQINQNSRMIAYGNRRQSWFKDPRLDPSLYV